jgi:putative MATE family efflux protein
MRSWPSSRRWSRVWAPPPTPAEAERLSRGAVNLAEGDIARHLIRLTIPMFLGISSMIVAAMIDTIYVGWIGTLELAAVSFTFPVVMALSTLPMGIGVGAASIIARVTGAGDPERVSRLATDAMLLVSALVIAGALALYPFVTDLFVALGADPDILPLSVRYMQIWLSGLPFFAIPMVATTVMRAVGNARLPGFLMSAGAGLQVMLAPVLIFGVPGFWDGVGFEGAAWGFVLSRVLTFGVTAFFLVRMGLFVVDARSIADRMASWREVLRIGVPSMVSNLVGPVSLAVTVALLAGHGYAVVAGFGVASRIESLATMVLMALSSSTGPFVGQNWGAGRPDRIRQAQSLGYRFAFAWGVIAFAVLAIFGRTLVGWINADPAVVEATYLYLLILPITYGFLGTGMVAGSTFVALGRPLQPLILSASRMIVFYVPMALVLEGWLGFTGVFIAAAVCNVLMGTAAFFWIRSFLATRTAEIESAPGVRA